MKYHTGNWDHYADTAQLNLHVPDRKNWRMATLMHIAETREQARENVKHGLSRYCDYFRDTATFPAMPNGSADACEYMINSGAACIGTPDDAIGFIERLLEETGGFGVLLEMATNWADWTQTQRHYELMARYVHPHFQSSREWRADSYAEARDRRDRFSGQSADAIQAETDRLDSRRRAAE